MSDGREAITKYLSPNRASITQTCYLFVPKDYRGSHPFMIVSVSEGLKAVTAHAHFLLRNNSQSRGSVC